MRPQLINQIALKRVICSRTLILERKNNISSGKNEYWFRKNDQGSRFNDTLNFKPTRSIFAKYPRKLICKSWDKSDRDRIGGGDPPKGGWLWPFSDHIFGAEGAEKWELLKIFGKNRVQWPILGAADAENFDKFRYFSEKSPNFVKVEAFIA